MDLFLDLDVAIMANPVLFRCWNIPHQIHSIFFPNCNPQCIWGFPTFDYQTASIHGKVVGTPKKSQGLVIWTVAAKPQFVGITSKPLFVYMEVSINGGIPKWMVYSGQSHKKNGWFGGNPVLGNFHIYIHVYIYIGWWFGTLILFFHNIWDNPSHWLIFFRGAESTNQYIYPVWCRRFPSYTSRISPPTCATPGQGRLHGNLQNESLSDPWLG